jgi:DNA-binding YbaB/EbfC family protein
MLGDLMGMMGKLKETQEKINQTKERLHHVSIEEQSPDGLIKVTITANRTLKNIHLHDSLLSDKEQLEDQLLVVLNRAIDKATRINETEMAAVAKEGMPNIPGMDMLFK